MEVKAEKENVC